MKIQALLLLTCALAYSTEAFSVETPSRRDVLRQAATAVAAGVAVVVVSPTQPALAINACPPRTQNCIRTTWAAPAGTKDVASSMLAILNSYPQEGQADVDKGGWTIAGGDLKASGKTKLEYTSGVGNFAKFFNGGKPFVDDLEIEVLDNGVVEIRSASRIGESDLGVNQKRLQFLASKARALGWEAPEPKY
jgi:Protein of unknown function (DUF1499)